MWTIPKVFIEFVTVLCLFMFWGFRATRHVGGLSSSTRDRTLAPRIGWRGPHLRTASACLLSHSSHVPLFVALWTAARQAPLSVGSSRQEYWSGLPCPPLGDLPDPDIKPMSLTSPALAGRFFTTGTMQMSSMCNIF